MHAKEQYQDPAEAESIFGSSASRSSAITPLASRAPDFAAGEAMDEDEVATPGAGALVPATVTVGTPLKLAPSAAAFRKPGTSPAVASVATMPGGNPLAP
jgi:nuclear pore complex protein Nup53